MYIPKLSAGTALLEGGKSPSKFGIPKLPTPSPLRNFGNGGKMLRGEAA